MKTKLLAIVLASLALGVEAATSQATTFNYLGRWQNVGAVPSKDMAITRNKLLTQLNDTGTIVGYQPFIIPGQNDLPFKNYFPGRPVNDFSGLIETDQAPCIQVKGYNLHNVQAEIKVMTRGEAQENINNFTMSNMVKGKTGPTTFSDKTTFIKESISNRSSLVFYYFYNVDYQMKVDYDSSKIENFLTPQSLEWYKSNKLTFFKHCGNAFVTDFTGGVRFIAKIQIDLSSNAYRQEIENTFNVKYKSLAELENTIKTASKNKDNSFSVDIALNQFGGDASQIGSAIGGKDFICSGSDISKCMGALENVAKYVQTIPAQIKTSSGKIDEARLNYYSPLAKKYTQAFIGFNEPASEAEADRAARLELESEYANYLVEYFSLPDYQFLKFNKEFTQSRANLANRISYLEKMAAVCYSPSQLDNCSASWKQIKQDFKTNSGFIVNQQLLDFYRTSYVFKNFVNLSSRFGGNPAVFIPVNYQTLEYQNMNNFCGSSFDACQAGANKVTITKSPDKLYVKSLSNPSIDEIVQSSGATDEYRGIGAYKGNQLNWNETINIFYR